MFYVCGFIFLSIPFLLWFSEKSVLLVNKKYPGYSNFYKGCVWLTLYLGGRDWDNSYYFFYKMIPFWIGLEMKKYPSYSHFWHFEFPHGWIRITRKISKCFKWHKTTVLTRTNINFTFIPIQNGYSVTSPPHTVNESKIY